MKVNILLKYPNATVPTYESEGAAAVDIRCVSVERIKTGTGLFSKLVDNLFPLYEYDTGIVMEVPVGYFVQLAARSSVSKFLMWLANGIGVIDSDYRGTIRYRYRSIFGVNGYFVGEKVGQAILMRRNLFEFNEVKEVSETKRGTGGFGSTGN